jgi:gamma-glutamylcyclotransferase (GGCT)/AIG2-like uncharacterized protein YtfP
MVTFSPEIILNETEKNETQTQIAQTLSTTKMNLQTTQTENPKRALKVELYEVTDPLMLARLDSLEGHPRWYRRTPVKTLSGENIEIYHMPLNQNQGEPTPEYLSQMFETE